MFRLDQRDPFVQLVFVSIPVALAGAFAAALVLEMLAPELRRPLFVPLGAAFFCGALAFFVERARGRYAVGVLGFVAALVLFPAVAVLLLKMLRVPYQAHAADFIALLPQAVLAPSFFSFFRNRFSVKGPATSK